VGCLNKYLILFSVFYSILFLTNPSYSIISPSHGNSGTQKIQYNWKSPDELRRDLELSEKEAAAFERIIKIFNDITVPFERPENFDLYIRQPEIEEGIVETLTGKNYPVVNHALLGEDDLRKERILWNVFDEIKKGEIDELKNALFVLVDNYKFNIYTASDTSKNFSKLLKDFDTLGKILGIKICLIWEDADGTLLHPGFSNMLNNFYDDRRDKNLHIIPLIKTEPDIGELENFGSKTFFLPAGTSSNFFLLVASKTPALLPEDIYNGWITNDESFFRKDYKDINITPENFNLIYEISSNNSETREDITSTLRSLLGKIYSNASKQEKSEIDNMFILSTAKEFGMEVPAIDRETFEKYSKIEKEISARIFGQPEATELIGSYLRKKVGNFLPADKATVLVFMGPTGVGKTEMTKVISDITKKKIFPINCGSDLGEKNQWSSFIGSPKGFVGSEDKSPFLEFLKENPDGILVFDELEKAHRDILLKLYAFFDDGKLRDGLGDVIKDKDGRELTFNKLTIILTTNSGEEFFQTRSASGERIGRRLTEEELKDRIKDITEDDLKNALRKRGIPDAFIGRLNSLILFNSHTNDSITKVTEYGFKELSTRFNNNGLLLKIDPSVYDLILDNNLIDFEMGARQISYFIEKMINDKLIDFLYEVKFDTGDEFFVSFDKERQKIIFSKVKSGEGKEISAASLKDSENTTLKRIKKKLPDLEKYLKTRVKGQDEAIDRIVTSLYRSVITSKKNEPTIIGLLGLNGTGKTEIISAVSDYFFGDETRGSAMSGEGGPLYTLEVNNINSELDIRKILGSGSHQTAMGGGSSLQMHLERNPDGGVIAVENLNPGSSSAIIPLLTSWLSNGAIVTENKRYNLSSGHIIFVTGNLLKELYPSFVGGIPSEEEIQEHMGEVSEAHIRMALQAFFPPALTGSFDAILLVNPITNGPFEIIYDEISANAIKNFEKALNIKIEIGESVKELISETGYSIEHGVRLLGKQLSTVIEDPLIKAIREKVINTGDRVKINYDRDLKALTIEINGKAAQNFILPFKAAEIKVLSEDLSKTAFHETAHGLVGYVATGSEIQYLSIKPTLKTGGVASMKPIEGKNSIYRSDVVGIIAKLLAGRVAEEHYAGNISAGPSDDIKRATGIAIDAVTKWGLSKEILPMTYSDKKETIHGAKPDDMEKFITPGAKAKIAEEINLLIEEGNKLALKIIKKNEPAFKEIAKLLRDKKFVNKEEFKAIVEKHRVEQMVTKSACEAFFAGL